MVLLPEFLTGDLPAVSSSFALGTEFMHVLRILKIRGMSSGRIYHFRQFPLIVQQRAGAEHILIKGLSPVIGHE